MGYSKIIKSIFWFWLKVARQKSLNESSISRNNVNVAQSTLEKLVVEMDRDVLLLDFFQSTFVGNQNMSSSRLLTDRVAHYFLGSERIFIDIGAWDPIRHSETYWLEKFHGWRGVLIEPNPRYADKLRKVRSSKIIEAAVISKALAGKDFFLQDKDDQSYVTENQTKFPITTVTLKQVFQEFEARPNALFIDIEGMEFSILEDLKVYLQELSFVSIETIFQHAEISAVMLEAGFKEIWNSLSGYNSWFISQELLNHKYQQVTGVPDSTYPNFGLV
jgi:FkbM family methyltransferase